MFRPGLDQAGIHPIIAGLKCRCPACGRGRLFKGFLALAPVCDVCGQSFAFADPADGPAFFVMTAVGILVIAAWGWWAATQDPPVWLQFATVFPALIIGCLAALRPTKAWLVASQFYNSARDVNIHHRRSDGSY